MSCSRLVVRSNHSQILFHAIDTRYQIPDHIGTSILRAAVCIYISEMMAYSLLRLTAFVPIVANVRGFTIAKHIGSLATTTTPQTTTTLFKGTKTSLAMSSSASVSVAEVKVGDTIPAVTMSELTSDGGKPDSINLSEICAGKKVALFGIPGAFTPGCSKSHLPSFMEAQGELKAKGVDLTICVATNDAYVMEAFGRMSGGSATGIRFLSDGAGELSKALGLVMETPVGIRTKRFSLIADDNVVTHFFSSAKESSDTWAPAVLSAL